MELRCASYSHTDVAIQPSKVAQDKRNGCAMAGSAVTGADLQQLVASEVGKLYVALPKCNNSVMDPLLALRRATEPANSTASPVSDPHTSHDWPTLSFIAHATRSSKR